MLTCDPGQWSGSGMVTFQWFVDGERVDVGKSDGQTGSTNPKRFRCRPEHVGRRVNCAVTKANHHGSTTVETDPIEVVRD